MWASLLGVALAACTGKDDPGADTGTAGNTGAAGNTGTGASGRILWTTTGFGPPYLVGLDTGSHKAVLDVPVTTGSMELQSLAVSDDQVWIGRRDGVMVVVDRATKKVAAEIDLTSYGEGAAQGEGIDLYHVVVGGGFAYTSPEYNLQPPILRIDARSFEVVTQADILDIGGYPTSMSYDGADLWIAEWNAIELVRADPTTLAVRGRVPLGQDPNHPETFGEFYGYGFLADSGDAIWVLDTSSKRLIKVDKATLTPRAVADLSDLSDFDTSLEFDANPSGVFLLLGEPGVIVRFDPDTGQQVDTYDFSNDGGVGEMAVGSDRLYVTTADTLLHDVREIDVASGRVLQTIHSEAVISRIAVQK